MDDSMKKALQLLDAFKACIDEHPIVGEWVTEIIERAEQTEPQTIRCPKCGRSDYIREFGKDFSVTAEEAGFKYKCINCNTYIEPQSDRKTENSSGIPNNCEPQTELVNNSPILAKDLVDDEFNPYDEECMRCMHLKLRCEFVPSYCHYEPRDEPHHSGEVTEMVEPQTDGYMTAEQTVDCAWK